MENETLIKFLQIAKKKTFASRISFPKKTSDGGKEYLYSKGDFVYKDKYFGSIVDTGQELVFDKEGLKWAMAYRGGMFEGCEPISKKCFSFLKKCLRKVPQEFPVRGPRNYKEKDWEYQNDWNGDFTDFVGEEKIFLKGKQIYFRNYLGGFMQPRNLNKFK